MLLKQVAILLTALVLAACQRESAPPSSAQPGNVASVEQAVAKSSPAISVNPASLYNCEDVVATVKWDASKSGTITDSTEIWVGPSDMDTKLFSAGGATGETRTGPWSRPGTHFLLKNKRDGKVLGDATIGGPACH